MRILRSTTRRLRRPAINDGVREPAYFEQRGDATHRFRMAEANISSRSQALIEILRRYPARGVVEIDEQITAENDIEQTVHPRLGALDDIGRRKPHRFAELVENLPVLRAGRRKIFVAQRQT